MRVIAQQALRAMAAVLLVYTSCWASEIGKGITWHVKDATVRFRIEKDATYAPVPDVHLSDLKTEKGSSSVRKSRSKGQWNGTYFKLNGKLYKAAIAISAPATVIYERRRKFGRFVALVGISDRADSDTSASLKVYADGAILYESVPLTKRSSPVQINVQIPSRAKQLTLVTKGSNMNNHRWTYWINAGFLLRGKRTKVSYVKLHPVGYDPEDFEPVVFTTTGRQTENRLLWTQEGRPMEILFDGSDGRPIYFVYLVPKDKYKPMPTDWEPEGGLVLETRYTKKVHSECDKLAGFLRVWNQLAEPIGGSLVDNIHHGSPIHWLSESGLEKRTTKGGGALYYYKGFFRVQQSGKYVFATASNWASHLLIDGDVVVSWPGKHSYRGGIRGQKRGQLHLEQGVHKLEYLNYSPYGTMFTLAAWQSPKAKLSIMTKSDFLSVRHYATTAIQHMEPAKDCGSFEWQIVDDWRVGHGGAALVQVRFDVIRPNQVANYTYRWKFDDGSVGTGARIEHVFLRPGMRGVTLEVVKGQEPLAEMTQKVHAHTLAEKIYCGPVSTQTFEKAITESDFGKLPISDLVNLCAFADGINRPEWKQQAVTCLMKRTDELVAESEYGDFCIEVGQYLRSAPIQQYDEALRLFALLGRKATQRMRIRQRALLCQAELLLDCFGEATQALKVLSQVEKNKDVDKKDAQRVDLAKAEALVALGHVEKVRDMLKNPRAGSKQPVETKDKITHMGMLRRARLLAMSKDEPVQLDYAMEKIDAILAQDPAKILMPSLNLVRLDIHLGRKEHQIAYHLAERLKNLELTDYYRLETLIRQVQALCGMKAIEQAKMVHETLSQEYPYSPRVDRAKKAIVETVVAERGR